MGTTLDRKFLDGLVTLHLGSPETQEFKWYITAVVALAGMNYSEIIPELYPILLSHYIPEDQHFSETRKLRETLTKACGIWGAAKTGTSTRALWKAIPEHLQDQTVYRAHDDPKDASKRAQQLLSSIYSRIPGYDMSLVHKASPDYGWIVNDFFYGTIFGFPEVLDTLETSQIIVAVLLSIDCQEQARNHTMGMQFNGAKRQDVQGIRNVVVAIAEKLGVRGKQGRVAIEVPSTEGFA